MPAERRLVHFYAGSWEHHLNHLLPIYLTLPLQHRGKFYARGRAEKRAKSFGITVTRPMPKPMKKTDIVVVASYEDYKQTRPAQVIFVNHGVGQRYIDARPADGGASHYSGGPGRDRCILFLGPSERDADISRAAYPHIPAVAVGVPYLDSIERKPFSDTVAISFHCNSNVVPETRNAWPFFRKEIQRIAESGQFNLLGHCHPRVFSQIGRWWKSIGVPYEPDWLKVLGQASVYCVDNSSSMYEAAAIGIPIVALNAPWYRRDVEHGLRFWSFIPGVSLYTPEDLPMAIDAALEDDITLQEQRAVSVKEAYNGLIDGHATERAVQAILDVVNT